MKTIGLLGGMSWESSQYYYREINQRMRQKAGGLHSAKIVMVSVDFEPVHLMQHAGNWQGAAEMLNEAARQIEKAGADFMLICTNTMHKIADQITRDINIPLLHIADATAETLLRHGINKVGLLGTAFTMEEPFYKQRLTETFGLEVCVPEKSQRELIHQVIYKELCNGIINPQSKQAYLHIVDDLAANGAEAVILGCTEIGLLIQQQDTLVQLFDTTQIHAARAVDEALKQ